MNLQYYSYKEDKVYEYNSNIVSKILEKKNSFDFTSKFELSIVKETTSLHIYRIENNYHLSLIEFNEKSQERTGIKIENLGIVNNFIDNYINELDFKVTKNSIEKYSIVKDKEDKEKFKKWKIEYEKKREKEKFDFLKPILLTLGIIFIFGISFYYWNSEEYKFIFSKNDFVKAEIIDIKMVHIGKGYYYKKINI
ncbi:hypothetical protein IU405_04320 [Polaribacter sp. BAL334]|uniref:hypothetical protein n=1 Tax=Polaribacter sp. BAL334 TaxID=1708178 RepID=UPI0018D21DCD|nr:hypothetical protein [Polaribacter sp. BAL334]MBG7611470.1 hypothetical protein [Polaribacter sp. BAL334]